MILSTTVIVVTNSSKSTVFSAYVTDSENENIQHQQISIMREDIAEDGYVVANTMSTPMLVNDWREPHRTLMVITAPEKPFDAAEADDLTDNLASGVKSPNPTFLEKKLTSFDANCIPS